MFSVSKLVLFSLCFMFVASLSAQSASIEETITQTPELSKLEVLLKNSYRIAYQNYLEQEKDKLKEEQKKWETNRNKCADNSACIKDKTEQRISNLQITGGKLVVPEAILYKCSQKSGDMLTVYFYNQTQIPTVVVNHMPDQYMLYSTPTGSGAHYVSDKAEFWEHQGEAMFRAGEKTLTCTLFKVHLEEK